MIENDKYNPTLELCLNLARSLQTPPSTVSFGRTIFKKEKKNEKKNPSMKN